MAQCTFQCPTTYPTNSHLTLPILNTLQMQSLNFEEPSLSTRDTTTHFLKVNMQVSLFVALKKKKFKKNASQLCLLLEKECACSRVPCCVPKNWTRVLRLDCCTHAFQTLVTSRWKIQTQVSHGVNGRNYIKVKLNNYKHPFQVQDRAVGKGIKQN